MSVNDYARLSNRDLELFKQMSDSSYISINGKRQAARNFKDGVLNLGTINFKQPKDVLTKEMILDYQREQQNKPAYIDDTTGDLYKYLPSNINEATVPFNPTLLPSGAAATENDIGTKSIELNKALKDLSNVYNEKAKNEMTKKKLEEDKSKLEDKLNQITVQINEKPNIERDILKLENDVKTEQNKIVPNMPYDEKKQIREGIKELNKKLTEKKDVLKNILKLEQLEQNIQADLAVIQADIILIDTTIQDNLTEIGKLETDIPNLQTELEQVKENFEQNKKDFEDIKRQNKKIAQKYEDAFNLANLNRFKVQQEPNESEEDFIKRLQALEQEKYDVNIYKDKVEGEQKKKLSENLKNIIRNDNIIWEVIKSLNPDEVFETNKYFNIISTRILKIFGYDNKNISAKNLQDEILKSLDIMKAEPENIYELEGEDTNKPGVTVSEIGISHANGTVSDFTFKVEDNALYVENFKNNNGIYMKIGKKDNQKLLFSSTTNLKGSYNRINFKERNGFIKLITSLQLNQDRNKDILLKLFGNELNKDDIYNHLSKPPYNLQPVDESIINKKREGLNKIMYGFGLNKVPETANFGKNIILLKKLYYNNILSVKDRNLHSIRGLKNVNVSDNFVKIIMDIITKQKPAVYNVNKLTTNEKELYNILLMISGIHKNIKIKENEKTKQINNLKSRLDIAEGEIKAGNDNPLVLSELQEIIYKLCHLNAVSLYNARNYLKQFKLPIK